MKLNKLFSFFALFFVLMSVSAFAQVAITASPAPLDRNSNLICTINGGNPSGYIYDWTLGTQPKSYASTVPGSATNVGETWTCFVSVAPTSYTGKMYVGQASVTIPDLAPVSNAGGPYVGVEGQPVTFTGSAVDPEGDTIASWLWNFGDGITSNLQNPTHIYANNRTYTVTLRATDSYGATGSTSTTTSRISDLSPVVNFNISQNPVIEGINVTFRDLSTSYDPIANWIWNFGDGSPLAVSQNTTHIYLVPGTYNVSLTVRDNDGSISSNVQSITVNAIPDTTPPLIFNITSSAANDTAVINWTTDELANSTVNYGIIVNDSSFVINHSINLSNLAPNTFYSFNVSSCDVFNNCNISGQYNFTTLANIIVPVINYTIDINSTDFNNTVINNGTINFTGNIFGLPNLSLQPIGNYTVIFTPDINTSFMYWNWTGNVNVSSPNLPATNVEVLGNGTLTAIYNLTVSTPPVNNAPIVTLVAPANNTLFAVSNVALQYTPTDDLSATLSCGLYLNSVLNSTNPSIANGTIDTINLVLADGTYNWNVICNDGSLNGSSVLSFFTVNTTAPPVHDVAIDSTYLPAVNINGSVVRNSTGQDLSASDNLIVGQIYNLRYQTKNNGNVIESYVANATIYNSLGTVVASFGHTHSNVVPAATRLDTADNFNTTGLPAGAYTLVVNSTVTGQTDSNLSNNFGSRTINLVLPPDFTAPAQISGLTASATNQSITWNWTNPINPDFNGTIIFLNGSNIVNLTSTTTGYTATGLLNATSYTLGVQTFDISRNINASTVNLSQMTLQNNDVIPPASASNLTNSTITNQSITWTWNNPSNPDFATVIVLLNGSNVLNTTTGTYTANNLSNNTAYTITLHTADVNGNVNLTDVNSTMTTLQNPAPPLFTIFNSTVNGTFYAATNSLWTNIDNSPITGSILSGLTTATFNVDIKVISSTIQNSNVTNSYLTTSTIVNSTILNSDLTNANVLRCIVKNIFANPLNCTDSVLDPPTAQNNLSGSSFVNSSTFNSNVTNSVVTNSNITNSNIGQSTITNADLTSVTMTGSNVNGTVIVGSSVISSNLTGGTLSNTSVTSSTLTNTNSTGSVIVGATLSNVAVTNSSVSNATLANMTILNAIIVNGNITNNGTIILSNGNNVTGPAQVPYAPVISSIGINPASPIVGDVVLFTAIVNIPNNDPANYLWTTPAGTSTATNPQFNFSSAGSQPIILTVYDTITGLNTTFSTSIGISNPSSSGGSSSSSGGGSVVITTGIDQTKLLAPHTYTWDIDKDGNPFTRTMRPIDSIIFVYEGTSYSLLVDKFTPDGLITLKVSPTEDRRTGVNGDYFNFPIKDKTLVVTPQEINFDKNIDSQSTIKLRLLLTDGKKIIAPSAVAPVIQKVKDGVIKIAGEIAPPKEASLPVGIGISLATVIVGLLLFLGIRKIWN